MRSRADPGSVSPPALRALVALGATVALLAPAHGAASVGAAPDLAIGGSRWDLVGAGVVSPTARGQRLDVGLAPGRTKRFTVRIDNPSDAPTTFRVSGGAGRGPFTAMYAAADGTDATEPVLAGVYEIALDAGERALLYLDVTAAVDAETGDRRSVWVEGATLDGSTVDRVAVGTEVPPIRIWGVNHRGTLRCDAELPFRTLVPGYETGTAITLTNLSDEKIRMVAPIGTLELRDQDGTLLWGTGSYPFRARTLHPFPGYLVIRPHRSVPLPIADTRIRWSGPIDVRPACGVPRLPMPSVDLAVTEPGAPSEVAGSIAAAVAEPASPWQACPPGPEGEATAGELATPDGQSLPPLSLRCWATVRREVGFDVVSLHLVSPSDAPSYEIAEDPNVAGWDLPGEDNMLALRWSFVVTLGEVRPYLSQMRARALGEGETVTYALWGGGWEVWGEGPCGFESMAYAPTGEVLILDWISACTQTTPAATQRVPRLVRLLDGRTLTA